MQATLNRFNKFAVQGVDLQLLLLFQHEQYLVVRVLPTSEKHRLWGLF